MRSAPTAEEPRDAGHGRVNGVPVWSVVALLLAGCSAFLTFGLFFLVAGAGVAGLVPTSLAVAFITAGVATFGFLITAVVIARKALRLKSWRFAWDANFAGLALVSGVGAVGTGLAAGFDAGGDGVVPVFWVLVVVLLVTLVRWTWWIWRAIESAARRG